MIDIYAVGIRHKLNEASFSELISHISENKRLRIMKFRNREDAQRILIADILIRSIIVKRTGIDNKCIIFDENSYGKPYLKNNKDFHFNISHAGEWIVCATHCLPVGIDIEHIRHIDFDIAKRFFTNEEYMDLMTTDSSNRLSYFYSLWTLKESYIKAAGMGMAIPLDSFEFKLSNTGIELKTKNDFQDCFFKMYDIDERYKMAVCGYTDMFPKEVDVKYLDNICKDLMTS